MEEEVPLEVWEDDILADFLPLLNKLPQFPKESAVRRDCLQKRPRLVGHPGICFGTGECQDWGLRVLLLTDSSVQYGRDTGHVGTRCCGSRRRGARWEAWSMMI